MWNNNNIQHPVFHPLYGLELGQAAPLVQSHKFPQDVVPDDNTSPDILRLHEVKFFKGRMCPVANCRQGAHAFREKTYLVEHWNWCHLEKTLKVICKLCDSQFLMKSQMRRHLREVHPDASICGGEAYREWWCICLQDRYIDPQGWFIPTLDNWVSSSGRRQLQTEVSSMAHMVRVDRKRKSAPPAAVSGSTSSRGVSPERQFFTPPTSPPPAKKYSIPSGALDVPPADVGIAGSVASATIGAPDSTLASDRTACPVPSPYLEVARTSSYNGHLMRPLFLGPVRPAECTQQMREGRWVYPQWYQHTCGTYQQIASGHSGSSIVTQALHNWPEMPSKQMSQLTWWTISGLWPMSVIWQWLIYKISCMPDRTIHQIIMNSKSRTIPYFVYTDQLLYIYIMIIPVNEIVHSIYDCI